MYIKFAPKISSPYLPLISVDAGCEKIMRTEQCEWPFYQMVCCYQGEGTVVIGKDSIDLKPGRLLLLKPGTVHAYIFRGQMYHLSWVSFTGYLADNLMEHYGIEPAYATIKDASHPTIHRDILSVLEEVENYFVIDRISVILYRILISFFMQYRTGPEAMDVSDSTNIHLQKAISWMKANLSSPVDINHISQELGLSRQHLTRLIRRKFGMSSIEFFTKLKLLEAQKDLVKRPERSIKEIAAKLGFTNSSHFARIFREYSTYSPSEFRAVYLHRIRSSGSMDFKQI
ncbi:AraC family transcriptional regulator [Paenibacillus eucommiae]|uniref:AraC-like DNA-binding protein n=1 Tax=Paenibacillus eucommiae TaxID=1355755 RepID=A0ABS4IQT3_9BACL|nr:AraC family transcriptional regulator [Paenibacillus eucommiae]MBP1989933.1 AraC-like DNA-binding protein [Paenibacillus eucommiae]